MQAAMKDPRTLRLIAVSSNRETTARLREALFGVGDVDLVAVFDSVEEALGLALTEPPDVVLFDLERHGSGLERLRNDLAEIADSVVVGFGAQAASAPGAVALDGAGLRLLPGVPTVEGLRGVLDTARSRRRATGSPASATQQVGPRGLTDGRYLSRLLVRSAGRVRLLAVDEILWIDAVHNAVKLHARSGEYRLRQSISTLAEALDPAYFVRIHRSTVIRLDAVVEFRTNARGQYAAVMPGGGALTVSHSFHEGLLARLRG